MERYYLDTSALAKWYINEPLSATVEAFIQAHAPLDISSLTVTEMRCLLARRRRNDNFEATLEHRIFATFQQDIKQGHLRLHMFEDDHLKTATTLISRLPEIPLRTLDALHLAIAVEIGATTVVTSDTIMSKAATALDLEAILFTVPRK
jgi:uncharacterized protein